MTNRRPEAPSEVVLLGVGVDAITAAVSGVLDAGAASVVVGGDRSITYPVLRAYRDHFGTG